MTFRSTFDLDNLNGSNGFTVTGISLLDVLGGAVSSAGDFNADGVTDFIVSATGGRGEDNTGIRVGESYVVFGGGSLGRGGSFDLNTLNGRNGFTLFGVDSFDGTGTSVSGAGDINNDGFDDIIVGAPGADQGESYVVFGKRRTNFFNGSLEKSDLNGSNGFILQGEGVSSALGTSVSSAGDFNGDGIADLIVGDPLADPNGASSGQSYVVFGRNNIGSNGLLNITEIDGSNGFALNGINAFSDRAGAAVSGGGDINNDGFDDIIISAPGADPDSTQNAGETYVVFGGRNVGNSGSFELSSLNGNNGFVLDGADRLDELGIDVSNIGDINDDGFDDLLVGTNSSGASYVVFGRRRFGGGGRLDVSRLNGRTGFVIEAPAGIAPGRAVSGAGDINNDGIADLLVGSSFGGAYAVFGAEDIGSSGTFDLTNILAPGRDDAVLFSTGINTNAAGEIVLTQANNGFAVSGAGDLNNDGIDDIIMANPNGAGTAGTAFIVFGQSENEAPIATNDEFAGEAGQAIRDNVLSNDTDPDGDSLTATLLNDVRNGSLTLRSNGSFTYRAESGFSGQDRFTYEVSDGNGGTDSATVILDIESGGGGNNRAPRARNDRDRVESNTSTAIAVLDNDSDPDGDSLSIDSVSRPNNGRATRRNNGTIVYRSNRGFSGRDSFTYTVSDGNGGTDEATVVLQVLPESTTNRAPRAQNDRVRVAGDQATTISVLSNDRDPDGDELSLDSVSRPENGRAIRRNNGTVLYRPDRGFSGRDSFTYTISDGTDTDTATVFVTVANSSNRAQARTVNRDALTGPLVSGMLIDEITAGGLGDPLSLGASSNELTVELSETLSAGQSSSVLETDMNGGRIELSEIALQIDSDNGLFAAPPLL